MIEEEKKYEKLIGELKNLPKIKAPQNFETNLLRKINSKKDNRERKISDWIFSPGKLVPAAVAIASAVIIFFVIDVKSEVPEDPLTLQPRLREDLSMVQPIQEDVIGPKQELRKSEIKNDVSVQKDAMKKLKSTKTISEQLNGNVKEDKDLRSESFSGESLQVVSGDQGNDAVYSQNKVTLRYIPVSTSKRENLNFMQINPSVQEREEIEKLKIRIQSLEKAKSGQK